MEPRKAKRYITLASNAGVMNMKMIRLLTLRIKPYPKIEPNYMEAVSLPEGPLFYLACLNVRRGKFF